MLTFITFHSGAETPTLWVLFRCPLSVKPLSTEEIVPFKTLNRSVECSVYKDTDHRKEALVLIFLKCILSTL